MAADHGHRCTSSATALVPFIGDWKKDCSGDPALVLRVNAERPLLCHVRRSSHIEFKNSSHRYEGLREIAILGPNVTQRLRTIDKQAAASPIIVLNDPVPPAVLTHQENRLSQARGRFAIVLH
jgi:hypothetical protein